MALTHALVEADVHRAVFGIRRGLFLVEPPPGGIGPRTRPSRRGPRIQVENLAVVTHARVDAVDTHGEVPADLLRVAAIDGPPDGIHEVIGHDRDVRRRRRDELQRILTEEGIWIRWARDDDRARRQIARFVEHVDERSDVVVIDTVPGPGDT